MQWIEDNGHARLTNYGEFLAKFPPEWEAEVVEDTSWSCVHGVERWRSNCGCNGGKPGWNQEWRGPLREALDYLRDATAPLAEALRRWVAERSLGRARCVHRRDAGPFRQLQGPLLRAPRHPHPYARTSASPSLELLEMERHTQLMYTSCGWFFDEVSGIETVQIIAYAGRVLQLAAEAVRPGRRRRWKRSSSRSSARAKSNLPELGDGAELYRQLCAAACASAWTRWARTMPSAPSSASTRRTASCSASTCTATPTRVFTSGRGKVALGRASIRSRITEEAEDIFFAVLHLGDQNLSAAVRRYSKQSPEDLAAFSAFSREISEAIRPRQSAGRHPR